MEEALDLFFVQLKRVNMSQGSKTTSLETPKERYINARQTPNSAIKVKQDVVGVSLCLEHEECLMLILEQIEEEYPFGLIGDGRGE